jgi:hypothetical protein
MIEVKIKTSQFSLLSFFFLRVKREVINETANTAMAAIMNGRPLFTGQAPAGRLMLEEIKMYADTALKAKPVQKVISDISFIILALMCLSPIALDYDKHYNSISEHKKVTKSPVRLLHGFFQ